LVRKSDYKQTYSKRRSEMSNRNLYIVGVIVLVAVVLILLGLFGVAMIVSNALEKAQAAPAPVAAAVAAPLAAPAVTDPVNVQPSAAPIPTPFVWDGKFTGVAEFYIDGDPMVNGWKTKDAEMTYVCTADFGIFVTMDPGSIQGVSTNDKGAVGFVPCKKGDVIKLTTKFWSESALHQQIHLVEIVKPLPPVVTLDALLAALKTADGKPVAYMFASDGTYQNK
jgi:hypothetical protein